MSELLDRCKAYGVDINKTMELMGGDEEFFESCLQLFSEDEGFTGLKQAIEAKDYKATFEHAHALKGVAGNLGLKPLFDTIDALVESLRSGDYSKVDPQAVEKQYELIIKEKEKVIQLLGE